MKSRNSLDQTPPPSTSERIRRDFSFAQVFASVLSTVTCMMLAPKIGLLGGLLGGAIGAAVAACASQLYRSVLNSTSEKLKYKQQQLIAETQQPDTKDVSEDKTEGKTPDTSNLTGEMKAMAENSLVEDPADKTQLIKDAKPAPRDNEEPPYVSHLWKYVLVIVAVTMVSVGIAAAIIFYATEGEGWGRKPDVVYITKYVENDNKNHNTKPSNTTAPAQEQPKNQDTSSEDSKQPEEQKPEEQKPQKEEGQQSPQEGQTSPESQPSSPKESQGESQPGKAKE